MLNDIAALTLVSGADFLSVFPRAQLDALAYLAVHLHAQGLEVVSIFWGLWLFPFGLLVIRSRFMPRVLGVLLILAGLAYMGSSFASLLLPEDAPAVARLTMPLKFGELPIVFWLLLRGAREPASPVSASSTV